MTRLRKLTLGLSFALLACSSETAIVATVDAQGGAVASAGGTSGASSMGGAAGALTSSAAGGARQESGGPAAQSGGLASTGGASGGALVASGGLASTGDASGGAWVASGGLASTGGASGGVPAGGVSAGGTSTGGSDALDGGAGGSSAVFCSCSESETVCDSDGETHVCFGNECPPVMILCLHECPCGAGDTGGQNNVWYPEECFDASACATTHFCVEGVPSNALVVTSCGSTGQRR